MKGVHFDDYAENYDAALDEAIGVSGEGKEFFARGRLTWLARRLPAGGHQRVLDFGCGTGDTAPLIVELLGATRVIGVDVSARSIERARETHRSERISFVTTGEYRPGADLDLAFCNGVFHHIPPAERPAAVDCVRASLRPGGLFALFENNPWNPATRFVMSRCEFDRDAITLPPPETRRLLRDRGFEVLHTDFLFIFPRPLRWLRWTEPPLCRLPLGTQYLVLARNAG
ncbi:MAG: class I SAM-dependent methyltransferase [Acidobacteria bacterium]|nr:class I SAM-dependent methyltransferase [Acidobacteriota bacterium]